MPKTTPEKAIHGGKKRLLEEKFGLPCIDFSASLNPFPPRFHWAADEEIMASYPDDTYFQLKEVIGSRFHRDVDEITVGNGSIELIRSFCFSVLEKNDRVLVETPTFGEYRFSAELAGAICTGATEDTRAHFLCNPNNPDGILRKKEEVREVLSPIPQDAFLLVDEAFIELSDPSQTVSDIMDDRLFVARSLTKAFAVPGIRFGYGFGAPELVERMEAHRLPWTVNTCAEAFAFQAFRHFDELEESRLLIEEERNWMMARFRDRGIRFSPSKANFLLLFLPVPGQEMEKKLMQRGILVRDCTSFGLPFAIRVAIRTHDENQILIDGLAACLP